MIKDKTEQVAWIPSEFAEVGKPLRIFEDDGWLVKTVYGTKEAAEVKAQNDRVHTGIFGSLKKPNKV